jgi:hypothetical protein
LRHLGDWHIHRIKGRFVLAERIPSRSFDTLHRFKDDLILGLWRLGLLDRRFRLVLQSMRVHLGYIGLRLRRLVDHSLLVGRRNLEDLINEKVIVHKIFIIFNAEGLSKLSENFINLYMLHLQPLSRSTPPFSVVLQELFIVALEVRLKHVHNSLIVEQFLSTEGCRVND